MHPFNAIENRPFKAALAGMLLSASIAASQCFGQNTLPTERIEDVDFFETRIRPLLIAHCLECHSDASAKTSGGLALDTRQGWQQGSDSGHVIVPGKPDESLLIAAIRRHEGVSAMPPDEGGKPLSQQEIEDLVTWISRGAADPRTRSEHVAGMSLAMAKSWWAFQPLAHPVPPAIANPDLAFNPIDNFIVKQLAAHGIEPLAVADKRTWIRRATLDLTGLVPTSEEIESFLNDPTDEAFATVIDRLLASPAYGERWGRHWLDVARYADTAGDGADYPVREASKYRDWVVRAFRSNMPWNEFLRQQIAGDIYAKEHPDSHYADLVTATGFLAIGKRYGYSPSPDFQHLDFADVIDSVGRSVLGLSIGCARCHDHKYDPITIKDYYGLYGILQSTQWAFPGGEEHKRPANFPPLIPPLEVQERERIQSERLKEIDQKISENQLSRLAIDPRFRAGGIDLDLESQELEKPPGKPWLSAGPNAVCAPAQSPFHPIFGEGTRGVRLGHGTPHEGLRYVFEKRVTPADGNTIHFAIDFRPLSSSTGNSTSSEKVAVSDQGSCRFYLGRGVIESTAIECSISGNEFAIKENNAWRAVAPLEPDRWYHLQLSIDRERKTISGTLESSDQSFSIDRIPVPSAWDGVLDTFICDGFGHREGPVIARDLDNLALQTTPLPRKGDAPLPRIVESPESKTRLADLDQQLAQLNQERARLLASGIYPVAYGVSDGKPVDAKIQLRGEPDKLSEVVPRRFLEIFGGSPIAHAESKSGRRDLANWLAGPSNPLTPRVWVNRVWHWHFGRGLVATTSDFGARGELPTHPELLDWLASEFVASGWDVHALHRTIMLSRTYRLSSATHSEGSQTRSISHASEIDPGNRNLWRFARRPLDAESIRDCMLQVSGLLDPRIPTEHPFPPVDSWAFTIHNPFHAVYESDHRSIYLMSQRNRRHPYLSLFDSADPNLSVAERSSTTTPTQSLFLMNSPFVHRVSAAFAKQILARSEDQSSRIRWVYEKALGRSATDRDIDRGLQFIENYRGANGQFDSDAAWSAYARVLLTSNLFLFLE